MHCKLRSRQSKPLVLLDALVQYVLQTIRYLSRLLLHDLLSQGKGPDSWLTWQSKQYFAISRFLLIWTSHSSNRRLSRTLGVFNRGVTPARLEIPAGRLQPS